MGAIQQFQSDFLGASSANRAMIVQKAVTANQQNANILNLLANVDLNYKKNNNASQEAQSKNKADNIFFICKMLSAFTDFRY
jgi:hypothetical protein